MRECIDMKRRDFLKILSVAPLVAAVPVLAKTNKVPEVVLGGVDNWRIDPDWAKSNAPATPLAIKANDVPISYVRGTTEDKVLYMQEARKTLNNAPVPNNWPNAWKL